MSDRLIFQSPIYKLYKCEYIAHVCQIFSFEDAKEVMAFISLSYYSAHCSPYAIRLYSNETNEVNEIYEDLGEFNASQILISVLRSYESLYQTYSPSNNNNNNNNNENIGGISILLMLTRKVYGCFVTDMIQNNKYNAIRVCATKAITKFNKKMFPTNKNQNNNIQNSNNNNNQGSNNNEVDQNEPQSNNNNPHITSNNISIQIKIGNNSSGNNNNNNGGSSFKKEKRNILPTPSIKFEPDSFNIPPILPRKLKGETEYRPGHFKDSRK